MRLAAVAIGVASLFISTFAGAEDARVKRGVETLVSIQPGDGQPNVLLEPDPEHPSEVPTGRVKVCNRSKDVTGNFFALNMTPGDFAPPTMAIVAPEQCSTFDNVWGVQLGAAGGAWTALVVFN